MSRPIAVVPYTDERVLAVRAFNQRVAASEFEFPETPEPGWMPGMELFLAVEDGVVRGGYILRRQRFQAGGRDTAAAHYRLPLSEGVVNRAYATLGVRLVRDALAREPKLYAMGMGGWSKPLPQLLKRLGWRVCEVPFHFKVLRAGAFLHNIQPLRTNALRRVVLDLAAITGVGWLGMKATGHGRRVGGAKHTLEASFAGWADEVWERGRAAYSLLGVRDSATLDSLYPPPDERFLRVRTAGGWAVVLATEMHGHKQFGFMRVGSIVDCMAAPEDAGEVIRAATGVLEARGVDLIISNQLHRDWSRALFAAGFRTGPSNYLLALSPAMAETAGDAAGDEMHFNRGDGDGPIHL